MMRFVRIFFLFFLLLVGGRGVFAQYFSAGQDPASTRWKQINTSDFQIIFPAGYEKKAKYMAAIFQDLLYKGGKNLKHRPKKFSVVVHTQSASTNGMVAWAPKRMELYTTSSQDNDSQLWVDHVSTHEYRHVIQLDKLEQGFTRVLNYVFGQQATAVLVGLYLPPWFLEGDAVCTETSLSESGRGRFPFFEQELRAQLLEKGYFSYDKAINGSYQDYATGRYKLGYYLVGKARIHYGDELWEKTLTRVGRRPLGITSFADGIKDGMKKKRDVVFDSLSEKQKEILAQGIKVDDVDWEQIKKKNTKTDGKLTLYFDTMNELQWEWKVQDAQLDLTRFDQLTEREKIYTNSRFPHQTESGEVIVLKEGLTDAAYFEIISKNGEHRKLFVPGYDYNIGFDYRNGKLIWSESKEHLRWEKADKSVLVMYDIKSRCRRRIKSENSLFAPAFSADGERIVAVETDKLGENYLVIIDAESGFVEQRIESGNDEFILTPKWGKNNSIVYILLTEKGKQLVSLDLETEKNTTLFDSEKHDISQPEVVDDYIFFTADFTGIDNVFAYKISAGKFYQVTSSRFGARDSHVNGKYLYYSNYTSDGYLPVKVSINPTDWKVWDGKYASFPLAENLSEQLGEKLEPDTTSLDHFEVRNYSKFTHLFNFHSWAPVFIDGLDEEADIGVSVASQNKLSTLLTTVGYKKETGFENGQFYLNLSYQGLFPIFDSKLTVGDRSIDYVAIAQRIAPRQTDTLLVNRTWRQWEWENSIRLPFTLSEGQYSTKIIPKLTYNLVKFADIQTQVLGIYTSNPMLRVGEYNIVYQDKTQEVVDYQLFAYNIAKSAPRDVQYRWAQIFEFNYRHTPFGDTKLGETWSAESHLYVPGFFKHHGIKLYGGYQFRSSYNSRYSNMIKSPRGMHDLYGEDIYTAGIDYALPLFYPDWNLGPLAYFKRIKMSAFVDYGYQKGRFMNEDENLQNRQADFVSFGAEFNTDLHILRFSAPIDFGVRIGYEDQTGGVFTDILISFNLSAF